MSHIFPLLLLFFFDMVTKNEYILEYINHFLAIYNVFPTKMIS